MPHLVLEYSTNILEKAELPGLFQRCHQLLVEVLPTELTSCKSRAIQCETYYLGNGDAYRAFVHVSLKVLPGRSRNTLDNAGHELIKLLQNYFIKSAQNLKLQISLEINELQPTYYKLT